MSARVLELEDFAETLQAELQRRKATEERLQKVSLLVSCFFYPNSFLSLFQLLDDSHNNELTLQLGI